MEINDSRFSAALFKSLLALEPWINVRDHIVCSGKEKLVEKAPFEIEYVFQPDSQQFVRNNVLFALVGPEIRRLWGVESKYFPELLREPYLGASDLSKLTAELSAVIEEAILSPTTDADTAKLLNLYQREIPIVYDQILSASTEKINGTGKQGVVAKIVHCQGVSSALFNAFTETSHELKELTLASPSQSTSCANDVGVVDNSCASDLDDMCKSMRGFLLSDELRRHLWTNVFLRSDVLELLSDCTHCEDEFLRFAVQRDLDPNDLEKSPVYEMTHKVMERTFSNAFNVTSKLDESSAVLTEDIRNASLLSLAAYALSGMSTERDASISALLVRVGIFKDSKESPLAEATLGLYKRFLHHFLPSLVLHRPFSVLSVATEVFTELQKQDPQYYSFLQNEAHFASHDPSHPNPEATHLAKSYMLLRGLLESGFVGYLPEYALLHCWDCIAHNNCSYGDDSSNAHGAFSSGMSILSGIRHDFSRVVLEIVKIVREKLVGCSEDILAAFYRACRCIKTKEFVARINALFRFQKENK